MGRKLTPGNELRAAAEQGAMRIAARNEQIAAMRLRGLPAHEVARRLNMSIRSVNNAFQSWREYAKERESAEDALEVLRELLAKYQALYERAALVGEDAESEATKVAAINTQLSALTKILELRQQSGLLPRDLGTLRIEADVRYVASTLIRILDEHGAPRELREQLIGALSGQALGSG